MSLSVPVKESSRHKYGTRSTTAPKNNNGVPDLIPKLEPGASTSDEIPKKKGRESKKDADKPYTYSKCGSQKIKVMQRVKVVRDTIFRLEPKILIQRELNDITLQMRAILDNDDSKDCVFMLSKDTSIYAHQIFLSTAGVHFNEMVEPEKLRLITNKEYYVMRMRTPSFSFQGIDSMLRYVYGLDIKITSLDDLQELAEIASFYKFDSLLCETAHLVFSLINDLTKQTIHKWLLQTGLNTNAHFETCASVLAGHASSSVSGVDYGDANPGDTVRVKTEVDSD